MTCCKGLVNLLEQFGIVSLHLFRMQPILWSCGFLLQRAHGCARSGRSEELDLQKDTGFVRGISDGTTADGLPPLEDLEDEVKHNPLDGREMWKKCTKRY